MSGLRHDKSRCSSPVGAFCRIMETSAFYLYIWYIPAGCGNLAIPFAGKADGVGKAQPDSDFVLYDYILYLSYGTVFSGYASHDLLSLSFIMVSAPAFLNYQITSLDRYFFITTHSCLAGGIVTLFLIFP